MKPVNQRIIDAIIQKANHLCPQSLALIGIYGSVATGDTHEKSDLDLMILINDARGKQLAQTFVLNDIGIGYDIYCTDWEMLESDAQCNHAHLSKLLDSKLIFVNDQAAPLRLEKLQKKALATLSSDERFEKARNAYCAAKGRYADCYLTESLSDVRIQAAGVIQALLDCVMLYHGMYFKKGVKRTFDEIAALNLPFDMKKLVLDIIRADTISNLRLAVTALMLAVKNTMVFSVDRAAPSEANLSGTYEEIYSNWKNKMVEAAENNDLYSSFINMVSFQYMLQEVEESVKIEPLDIIKDFTPDDLYMNAYVFDSMLECYLKEYKKAGIRPKVYADVEEFVADYL